MLPLDSFQGELVSFDFNCVQPFNQFTSVPTKFDCTPFVNSMVSYVCSSSEMATPKVHMNENAKKGEENRTFEASKTKTIFLLNYLD